MKRIKVLIYFILISGSFVFLNCSKDEDPEPEPVGLINLDTVSFAHSMKGWELYSWPNGNGWNYSILIGTNRLKTYDEVITNDYVVFGEDSLKMLLNKLPTKEEIFWIGEGWLESIWGADYGNLSLPDIITILEIENYCSQKELILSIDY